MLKVSDLHAFYGKSHILQGVNFEVAEGEIVSLLGRNGVGRSTTVKTIMGEETVLIIENHYLGDILSRGQFDTFYHEHPRTYSFRSFKKIQSI